MTAKEQYAEFCQHQPDMPVMMQPWWLEAVCAGKEWDVMLFTERDLQPESWWAKLRGKREEEGAKTTSLKEQGLRTDQVVAVLPYMLHKRLGYRFIVMPQMTMFGGAWMNQDIFGDPDKQQRLAELITQRLKQLHVAFYLQDYCIGNPLPHWLKKKRFNTREIHHQLISPDLQQTNADSPANQDTHQQITAEIFYQFYAECMKAQGTKTEYSREFLIVLNRKASRTGRCELVSVGDTDGKMQAAAFIVWDNNALYPLITCSAAPNNSDIDHQLNQLIANKAVALGVNIVYPGSSNKTSLMQYRVWKFVNPWLTPFFHYAYKKELAS